LSDRIDPLTGATISSEINQAEEDKRRMISMYVWQQVKALRAQGYHVKQIARRLKISRNTVKKYLRSSDPPQFHAREYSRKSDSYLTVIGEMIKKGFIGTRIHEELTALGFTGSLSTVERVIQTIKKEKARKDRITTRVETPPGRQMQYDWKEWELPVNGKAVTIYTHETILGFSRKKYYTFSLTITGSDIIRAIHEALAFYGGVPLELVMDNAKQMVITHERSGAVLYNEAFLKFMGLMGIDLNPCQNYRARTKGKVERPFYHLQEHLLRGCEVEDLCVFAQKLTAYTEKVNSMVHATLKETADERFAREQDSLKPLPGIDPALLYPREIRGVSNDGYLPWGGSHYPVPMELALHTVLVEPVFGRMIHVYDEKGKRAATYDLSLSSGYRPSHPEHEEMNRVYQKKKEAKKSAIVKTFSETFPDHDGYLEALRKTQGPNLYAHLREIVSYTDLYPVEEIARILHECMAMGAFHKNTVKRLLASKALKVPALTLYGFAGPAPLRRNLAVYREVVHE
jgi:transposase